MIKELGIQFDEIEPSAPDMPFSIYSGAGVIFGVTGGVTEAALRHVAAQDNETMRQLEYTGIRGLEGVKVAEVEIGEKTLRIGVVNGLGNADNLLEKIRSGEEHFDYGVSIWMYRRCRSAIWLSVRQTGTLYRNV